MKKKERKYLSEQFIDRRFFVDYLPTKIYYDLTPQEKVDYREYRRYSYFISRSKKKIEDLESQIKKIQSKIHDEIKKHKDFLDIYYSEDGNKEHRDVVEHGWDSKMKNHYEKLTHIHQKFDFTIWWEKRPISNKTLKQKSGELIFPDTEILRNVTKYRGRELELRYRWYIKIKGVGSKPSKNIYLGDEESIRTTLSDIYQEDFFKDDWGVVKDELRSLIESYVIYNLMNKGWDTFMKTEKFGGDSHSLRTIKEWSIDIGDERYNYVFEKKDFTKDLKK